MYTKDSLNSHQSLFDLYTTLCFDIKTLKFGQCTAVEIIEQLLFFIRRLGSDLAMDVSGLVIAVEKSGSSLDWRLRNHQEFTEGQDDILLLLHKLYAVTSGLTEAVVVPTFQLNCLDFLRLAKEVTAQDSFSLEQIETLAQQLSVMTSHYTASEETVVNLELQEEQFNLVKIRVSQLLGKALAKCDVFLHSLPPGFTYYALFVCQAVQEKSSFLHSLCALAWEKKRSHDRHQRYWFAWLEYLSLGDDFQATVLGLTQAFDLCKNYALDWLFCGEKPEEVLHCYLYWSPVFNQLLQVLSESQSVEGVCAGLQNVVETARLRAATVGCYADYPLSDYPFLSLCKHLEPTLHFKVGPAIKDALWWRDLCALALSSPPMTPAFIRDCSTYLRLILRCMDELPFHFALDLRKALAVVKETSPKTLLAVIQYLTSQGTHELALASTYITQVATLLQAVHTCLQQGGLEAALAWYQRYLQTPEGPVNLDYALFSPLPVAVKVADKEHCRLTPGWTTDWRQKIHELNRINPVSSWGFEAMVDDLAQLMQDSTQPNIEDERAEIIEIMLDFVKTRALQQAAADGWDEDVCLWLKKGVDPAADEQFALNIAVIRGHFAVVKRLLSHPKLSLAYNDYFVVRTAVYFNQQEVLEGLLAQLTGDDKRAVNRLKYAFPTDIAFCQKLPHLLMPLLQSGIRPQNHSLVRLIHLGSVELIDWLDAQRDTSHPYSPSWETGGCTALVSAASEGDEEKVQWLLVRGLGLVSHDKALVEAIHAGHLTLAMRLLPGISLEKKQSICEAATALGDLAIVRYLVSDLPTASIESIFSVAITQQSTAVIKLLLIDKNCRFSYGFMQKILKKICQHTNKNAASWQGILDCLLAVPSVKGEFLKPSLGLSYSLAAENAGFIHYFIQRGADPYRKKAAALQFACKRDDVAIAQILLSHQRMIPTQRVCDFSPLRLAQSYASHRVIRILLQDDRVQREVIYHQGKQGVETYLRSALPRQLVEIWRKFFLFKAVMAALDCDLIPEIMANIWLKVLNSSGLTYTGPLRSYGKFHIFRESSALGDWVCLCFNTRDAARDCMTANLDILWEPYGDSRIEKIAGDSYGIKIPVHSASPRLIYTALQGSYPLLEWENVVLSTQAICAGMQVLSPQHWSAFGLGSSRVINHVFIDQSERERRVFTVVVITKAATADTLSYQELQFKVRLTTGGTGSVLSAFGVSVDFIEGSLSPLTAVGVFALIRRQRPDLVRIPLAEVSRQPFRGVAPDCFWSHPLKPVVLEKSPKVYACLESCLWSLQSRRKRHESPSVAEAALVKLLHLLDGIVTVVLQRDDFKVLLGRGEEDDLFVDNEVASVVRCLPTLVALLEERYRVFLREGCSSLPVFIT